MVRSLYDLTIDYYMLDRIGRHLTVKFLVVKLQGTYLTVKLLPIPEPVEQTPLNTTTEWKVDYPSDIVNNSKPGQVPKNHIFQPLPEELHLGQAFRYFTKKSNQKVYFEISKDTFGKLSTKSNEILFQLYTPITMIWRLEGNDDEVFEANL